MLFLLFSIQSTISTIVVGPDNHFIDENGAILIFHGVNVVYKQAPYIPITEGFDYMETFSEDDCKILNSFGFNVIRLHVSFEGGMPTKGVIDYEYLIKIRDIVRMAAKYDIYVILDAHQDLFNRQFCGNGFPDWAVSRTDFPYPSSINITFDEKGYPLLEDCYKQPFALFYTTNDIGKHFEDLYNNVNNLTDYFGYFWQAVAEIHKNEENVIGYEILNEPAAGNYQKGFVDYLWPGFANRRYLMPFYQKINKYIRQEDENKIVFFQSDFLDVLGGSFDGNIGGPKFATKEVFSYHVYCGIETISDWICNKIHNLLYWLKIRNVRDLGIGGFLTEFGAVSNDQQSESILKAILDTADYYQQSWAYWQYKGYKDHTTMSTMYEEGLFHQDGSYQKLKVQALARPYAQKICALKLHENYFDSKKKEFRLKYQSRDNCTTEIFIPTEFHYQNGFDHECKNCKLHFVKSNHYELVGNGSVELYIY